MGLPVTGTRVDNPDKPVRGLGAPPKGREVPVTGAVSLSCTFAAPAAPLRLCEGQGGRAHPPTCWGLLLFEEKLNVLSWATASFRDLEPAAAAAPHVTRALRPMGLHGRAPLFTRGQPPCSRGGSPATLQGAASQAGPQRSRGRKRVWCQAPCPSGAGCP